VHNIITSLPIALDVFLIIFNSRYEYGIPFFLVSILMGLIFVINPFHKLTHVAFHLLLIAQTYYLCLSHTNPVLV
jgi:hypothetical protein